MEEKRFSTKYLDNQNTLKMKIRLKDI